VWIKPTAVARKRWNNDNQPHPETWRRSVTPDGNGVISLEFGPKASVYWTASVNGIVLKP
jgi:hypothetical protein